MLLWLDELNPRVRCAFGNVSSIKLINNNNLIAAGLWPVGSMWPFSRLYNSSWTGGVGRRPGVGLQTKVSGDEGERKGSAGT